MGRYFDLKKVSLSKTTFQIYCLYSVLLGPGMYFIHKCSHAFKLFFKMWVRKNEKNCS